MDKKLDLEGSARRDVVLMLLHREERTAVLSRRYRILEQTLYGWRDKSLAFGKAALVGAKSGTDPRNRQIGCLGHEVLCK